MTTTKPTHSVEIAAEPLALPEIIAVARHGAWVGLCEAPVVRQTIERSRQALLRALERGEIIYGVNTGFGGNVRLIIPESELRHHQENLLENLACGVGDPLPREVVRAAMLLRANTLARGFSGVRLSVIERLLDLLNHDITPVVPRWGSVGASGDLCPSAYIARGLLGRGEVFFRGERMPAARALAAENIGAIRLEPKEGLGLLNGTAVMTAIAALALWQSQHLLRVALGAVALAVPLEEIREHVAHEAAHAAQVVASKEAIQSPYSMRCAPQGLGPMFETLEQARLMVEREANSVNDNPLIDPESGRVFHTGNFYGGHIARAMDGLKLDLANLANWAHSMMALLMDERFSNGLPASLSPHPGVYQGFKGTQIVHTSLVTALRQMSSASSVHTLPTEQFNQDIVSLGTNAALGAYEMAGLLRSALSILLLSLAQAVDLRGGPDLLAAGTAPLYRSVRRAGAYLDADRPLDVDIARLAAELEGQRVPVLQ